MNADQPPADESRFPSLSAVKSFHGDLRKRFSAAEDKRAMVEEIEQFVRRGRATGTLLDDSDDRWSCQSMLDYWLTTLYDYSRDDPDSTLADFDPMTAPELPDEDCPYVGLDAFREADADLFVGRKHLVEQLVAKLADSQMLLITGSSGGGKSSLVLAGLLPALKSGALPGSETWQYCAPIVPGKTPVANLQALAGAAATDAPRVIVIDQFEELFTLCDDREKRAAFAQSLLSMVEAGDRVVLTMRSDFEPFLAKVPALEGKLENSQIVATPLGSAELRRAIEEPAKKVGLKFEKGVVDHLVEDLVGEPAGLPLLQFTLMKLWENRTRNRITLDAYHKLGGGRLALQKSADKLYFDKLIPEEQRTAKRIFLKLVQPGEGLEFTRKRVSVDDVYGAGEARDRVDRVLEQLIGGHLIRRMESDSDTPVQLEVVHEALVRNWPTLVDWLEEARHALRHRAKLTSAAEEWQRNGKDKAFLHRGDKLADAERLIREAGIEDDLNPAEKSFVQASRDLREAEIRKEKRERMILRIGLVAVSVLAVVAIVSAISATTQATKLKSANATITTTNNAIGDFVKAKPWLERAMDKSDNPFCADLLAFRSTDPSFYHGVNPFDVDEIFRPPLEPPKGFRELGLDQALDDSREILNRTGIYPVWQSPLARHDSGAIRAISSNGKHLAAGGDDGVIRIWNLENNKMLHALPASAGGITSIAFSPTGNLVASSGGDKSIRLWNSETGQPVGKPIGGNAYVITSLAFGRDGKLLVSSEKFGSIKLRGIEDGKLDVIESLFFSGEVAAIAVSPDGQTLAVGGDVDEGNGKIKFWDLGRLLDGETEDKEAKKKAKDGHWCEDQKLPVSCLAFDSKNRLASAEEGGLIRLRTLVEGKLKAFQSPRDHGGEVASLAFTTQKDGTTWLASSGAGGSIKLWEVQPDAGAGAGTLTPSGGAFAGHLRTVATLAFDSNSNLISGGHDGLIKRWDMDGEELELEADSEALLALRGQQAPVGVVAMSPDGRILAAGGRSGRIDFWDLSTEPPTLNRSVVAHLGGVTQLAFNRGGTVLVSGGRDGAINAWDPNSKKKIELPQQIESVHQSESGKEIGVTGLEFHPNGKWLASCGGDGSIRWCDWETKSLLPNADLEGEETDQHKVSSFAFSPDGKRLATGAETGIVTIFQLEGGEEMLLTEIWRSPGHGERVTSLAFSSDGMLLASGSEDSSLIVWSADDGSLLTRISEHQSSVNSVAFAHGGYTLEDGKAFYTIASASETVRIWKLEASRADDGGANPDSAPRRELRAEPPAILSGYPLEVTGVAFGPDGRSLVSATHDGHLRLWMVAADEPKRLTGIIPHESANGIAISPSSKYLAAGCNEGVMCWDLSSGVPIGSPFRSKKVTREYDPVKMDDHKAYSIAFGRDDEWVAGVFKDNTVQRWRLPPGADSDRPFDDVDEHTARVFSIAVSPMGKQIIASGGDDSKIRLRDAETGEPFGDPLLGHRERITGLAFSSDGTKLVSAGTDKSVRLWKITDAGGEPLGKKPIFEGEQKIRCLAIDAEGRRIAWGGDGNDLVIWDLEKGAVVKTIPRNARIWSVSFHPGGKMIAIGGGEFVVKILDIESGRVIRRLVGHKTTVRGLTFSQNDGGRFLAASSDGLTPVLVWDVDSVLFPDFSLYSNSEPRWLTLEENDHDVRWNAVSDRLTHGLRFSYANLAPSSHIGVLTRADLSSSAEKDEVLFGSYIYTRNWNSALAVFKKLDPAAQERLEADFKRRLDEAKKSAPSGSAALCLDDLDNLRP